MSEDIVIVSANIARRNRDNTFTATNEFTDTTIFNGISLNVAIKTTNYTITPLDDVIVFTSAATATLPSATGSGQTYRICNESLGTVTIDSGSSGTIKGSRYQYISPSEDLIITDYTTNKWC